MQAPTVGLAEFTEHRRTFALILALPSKKLAAVNRTAHYQANIIPWKAMGIALSSLQSAR